MTTTPEAETPEISIEETIEELAEELEETTDELEEELQEAADPESSTPEIPPAVETALSGILERLDSLESKLSKTASSLPALEVGDDPPELMTPAAVVEPPTAALDPETGATEHDPEVTPPPAGTGEKRKRKGPFKKSRR